MSASCTSIPTLTQTSQVVTQSLQTTSTSSVTTTPPTTTTVVTTSCISTLSGSSCVPTSITLTSTIPAVTATVQVPLTLTVDVTSNALNTLFGSSCTTISTSNPAPTTPPPVSTTSFTTPPPTVVTSESTSTQANGSVIVQTLTATETQAPVPVPTTVQHSANGNSSSTQIAPIIGGVVGGFFGLLAIVLFIWFILKRRRRWDDIFEKEDEFPASVDPRHNSRFSLGVDVEPKPYHYGLVGRAGAPDPASPPHSPTLPAVAYPSAGSYNNQSRHERRRSSLTPLNLPMTASTPGPSATSSSRPSTGGSTQPLRPHSQQGIQQQGPDFSRNTSASTTSPFSISSGPSFTTISPYSNRGSSPDRGTGYGMSMGMAVLGGHNEPDRTGSPASMEHPPRRLTIANATTPESPTSPFHDSSSSAATLPAAEAVATAVPQRDGKGRMRTIPPKAPIVHLDGGRLQQQTLVPREAGRSSSLSGPLPPAYEV